MKKLFLGLAVLLVSFSASALTLPEKITVNGKTDKWIVTCGGSGLRALATWVKDKSALSKPDAQYQSFNANTGFPGLVRVDAGGDNAYSASTVTGVVDGQYVVVYVTKKGADGVAMPYDIQFQCNNAKGQNVGIAAAYVDPAGNQ